VVVPGPSPASRRTFLGGGAAAASAALLSACSGSKPLREVVRGRGKVTRADVEPLNALLDVEHYAIAAYAAGVPLLRPHSLPAKAAVQFLAQELAHAVQLSDLIRQAHAKPHRPRSTYALGHPRGEQDVLALLKRLEQAQLRAYLDAIPRLSGGPLRAAVAAIFANDAQHLAVLRWQTGEAPAPSALVTAS
jgi:Ferritin-like domain